MTEVGTNGAVYRARQMYKGSKSVVSTLCYGVQWDAALRFIATKDATYPTNSDGKGNYSDSPVLTGANDNYAINNIYDMAGNVSEWTMEAYSSGSRFMRGGFYGNNGANGQAYSRNGTPPALVAVFYGFRPALYVK